MKEKRPGALLSICILSWVYIGFEIIIQFNALFSGPMSDDQIREAKIEILQSQTEETIALMGEMINEMISILEITRDHIYTISSLNLLTSLTGALAVFMMFQGKKRGFHLYIIYSLMAILTQTYFFSGFTIGVVGIVFAAFISTIFVFIYSRYLKWMS